MKLQSSKLTKTWLAPFVLVAITIVIAALGIEMLYQFSVVIESIIETSASQVHHQIIFNH